MGGLLNHLDPQKLFTKVDKSSPVLVAVSGGSDSIALLLLSTIWARKGNIDLRAITIDHGLREDAAAETAFVAALCQKLGVPHVVLAWDGLKPQSGLSQAARLARYQLIEKFADEIGAISVLVGHQANDQVETILMRNNRASDNAQMRGLSGIAPISILPKGTYLHRPLLDVTRQRLRDYLREHDQAWIEDPSNEDFAYERVRIRARVQDNKTMLKQTTRFAKVMGRYRRTISNQAARILEANLEVSDGPVYRLKPHTFDDVAPQVVELVLGVCISMAGGAEYLPNVKTLMNRFAGVGNFRRTLGGAVIEHKNGKFLFYRESRNVKPISVAPGEFGLWDGRFLVENRGLQECHCNAFSAIRHIGAASEVSKVLSMKSHWVLDTTLCLQRADGYFNLPHVEWTSIDGYLTVKPVFRAIEYFCSEYDFAIYNFLQRFKQERTFEQTV